MTAKQPDPTDINALAMEACDMWQEHLSSLANDPSARAELTRFLEPQRRLFADWASMMRQGGSYENRPKEETAAKADDPAQDASSEASGTTAAPAPATAQGLASHGDDPLRVAQLALRLAELEKRVAQLEIRLASAAK
jgi:uncharacterized protein YceH (UPF0502 family)